MLCPKCNRTKAERGSNIHDFFSNRDLCWNGEFPRMVPMGVGDIIDQAVADCRRAQQGDAARSILDTATDAQTGFVWVCLGTNRYGTYWATYTEHGGSLSSMEFESGIGEGHASLTRAIKSGVTKAVKQ